MVFFSSIVVSLLAISTSLASPAIPVERNIAERDLPDFDLTGFNATAFREGLRRRQSANYNQDYTTGGTVDFSGSGSEFSVTWDTSDDFVVGRGWSTGTTAPITFDGSCTVNSGTGYLTVYGWTTNPLIEYYIIETNSGLSNSGSTKGSVTSDGSSYVIWENQRVNEPSITGTATFEQYISVRSSHRTSGTVTLENHFNAWASLGMNLGTFNFQVIAVEGWGGSGSASQTVSKGTSSGSTGTTTTTASGTGSTGSSGSCSVLYGQCGGVSWTGPKCCSSGSCTYSSAYYSQCLG